MKASSKIQQLISERIQSNLQEYARDSYGFRKSTDKFSGKVNHESLNEKTEVQNASFIEWLGVKLGKNIGNVLGSGTQGVIFDMGYNVLKISPEPFNQVQSIINKNIAGIAKIYSHGSIQVPRQFQKPEGNTRVSIDVGGAMDIRPLKESKGELFYLIMEKLYDGDDVAWDLQMIDESIGRYYWKQGEKQDVDTFELLKNITSDTDSFRPLYDHVKEDLSPEQADLMVEWGVSLKNIAQFFKWKDAHIYQFALNQKGELVAFDFDNPIDKVSDFTKHTVSESTDPQIRVTDEIKKYVQKFETDEALLRSGGIPIDILDRAAHGFSKEDVKTISPKLLKVRWHDDLESVKWEVEKSGLSKVEWSKNIDLSEPIDVSFMEEEGLEKGFYIEDGHHRYYAAKTLGHDLNVKLEIKVNPISEISNLGYDEFHRELFRKYKSNPVQEAIRKMVEEQVISETQDGQKDLQKFTNDILKAFGSEIVDKRDHNAWLDPESPHLRNLPSFFTGKMDGKGFVEIEDFVRETSIKISLTTIIGGKKETKGQLSYGSPDQNQGREILEIYLRYSQEDLDEINNLFVENEHANENDVYFIIYYMFHSTLLHELQHAYDAWRSKGKAFSNNRGYEDRKQKARELSVSKPLYDLTPEELEAVESSRKEYLNLVSEINARYAQAVQQTRFYKIDKENNKAAESWDNVFSSFKTFFYGWSGLSDKMKRRLTQRVSKAYQEISEKLQGVISEVNESLSDDVWYHGTPDARDLESQGGFDQRYINVSYIENPDERDEFQMKMNAAKESGDEDEYFRLLDIAGSMRKEIKMKSPVFLTNKHQVARTYADPQRSMDYQNAEEKVVQVKVDPKRNVKIVAIGDRFRFIDVRKVKRGFLDSGISSDEFDKALRSFNFHVQNKSLIKTDLIAAIAQHFGFDSIDVVGVLDSREGGSVKSTVRMVFDSSNIKLQNLNEDGLNEGFGKGERSYLFSTNEWDYRVSVYANDTNPDFPYFGFKAKEKGSSDFHYDMGIVTNDDIYQVVNQVSGFLKKDRESNDVKGYSISTLQNKKGNQRINFYIRQLTRDGWDIDSHPSGYPNHLIIKEGYSDVSLDYILNHIPKLDTYPTNSERKSFDSYTLLYEPYNGREGSYGIIGKVRAFDNEDGTEIGNVSFMPSNGKLVGSIDVRSDKRRQKVGTEMYKFVEEIMDQQITPDTPHTDLASKFWAQPDRQFGNIKELKAHYGDKIPSGDIFFHDNAHKSGYNSDLLKHIDVYESDAQFETNPVVWVDVAKVVPTQRFLNKGNLEDVKGMSNDENTGAYLVGCGGLYYVIDGHHRIANQILNGFNKVKAFVQEV